MQLFTQFKVKVSLCFSSFKCSRVSAKCWLISILRSGDISEHLVGSTHFTSSSLDDLLASPRAFWPSSSPLLRALLSRGFLYQTGSANCMACNHMLKHCCGEFLFLETQRSLFRLPWSCHMMMLNAQVLKNTLLNTEFPLHINTAVIHQARRCCLILFSGPLCLTGLAASAWDIKRSTVKNFPSSQLKSDLTNIILLGNEERMFSESLLHYFCFLKVSFYCFKPYFTEVWAPWWSF